jgi:pyruvate/2-oxoglutarate dehydrogenase complex dihydrolipoamide acyltransferase (E2) component
MAPGTTYPYPRLRNFILDVLAEGKRKSIAHILFDAELDEVVEQLTKMRHQGGEPVSLTSYIVKSFACAIAENKRMQAYRFGRSRLIAFDDVDLAILIEREWEGEAIPVFYLLRAAQHKTVYEISREIRAARETALGTTGPMTALEMHFFLLPVFLRKVMWFFIRLNPYWFKNLVGTAAVTSMGMYTSGTAVGLPITPMTLTLSVGTIEKKPVLKDGHLIERDFVHLNLSIDHDIIDGAPLMRFAERFKQILRDWSAILALTAIHEDKERTCEARGQLRDEPG